MLKGLHKAGGREADLQTTVLAALLVLFCGDGLASAHRDKGYQYLSPVPGAECTSPQTRFVLVRFESISPGAVTNLSGFIQVTGASSGSHPGQTQIASDGRTVIFTMASSFYQNELVTVALTPGFGPGAGGSVEPYQYQFMISKPMPDGSTISASSQIRRGGALSPWTGGNPARSDPPATGDAGTAVGKDELPPSTPTQSPSDSASGEEEPPVTGPGPGIVGQSAIMPNGVSVPSDFPHIDITVNDNPDSG